jgi:hypothetical protein
MNLFNFNHNSEVEFYTKEEDEETINTDKVLYHETPKEIQELIDELYPSRIDNGKR